MDPYIESSERWGDFHASFVVAMRTELNGRLPPNYVADVNQYAWSRDPDEDEVRLLEPDAYVSETVRRVPGRGKRAPRIETATTVTFPRKVRRRQRYVRIVDRDENRVVTAIEVLSPSNKKAGEDREKYLAKREEYLAGHVSLVEIDLLRGSGRLPLGTPAPEIRDYYVLFLRSWEFPKAEIWNLALRDPLPEIPIPLREDVPDVLLPLRPCFDQAYEGGRYATTLRYHQPLKPRARPGDAGWIRELLAARTSA
jgi:hypothetical protein